MIYKAIFQKARLLLLSQPMLVFLCNFLFMMLVFSACRLLFFFINKDFFQEVSCEHLISLLRAGVQFDITALLYTNIIYLLLMGLPFRFRHKRAYLLTAKWFYFIPNILAVILNLTDIVYFQFTGRRTSCAVFNEFKNESNLFQVFMEGVADNFLLVLCFVVICFLIKFFYLEPNTDSEGSPKRNLVYYPFHIFVLLLASAFVLGGIRGGFTGDVRPITLSNANKYVNKQNETAIVLNTPFCLYRTVGGKAYREIRFFDSEAELEQVFTPIHKPRNNSEMRRLNVVVLILESFGKEHIGFFNRHLDGGTYTGYTPFLDSLIAEGLTFKYSYSNGRKSIDAMPSVLSSIPMFIEPFISTPYSTNKISGLGRILSDEGYFTAFFHGAPNGSMGFDAYAKSCGFQSYYGMTEYGNDADFDNIWGIWDEKFLDFYAEEMNKMPQPFATSVFTVSSHHPFQIPAEYEGKFPLGTKPIHKCIGYTDNALRLFFKKMSNYDWFENTLFVITADHINQPSHDEYLTDQNLYSVPILFYHKGGILPKYEEKTPIQQTDILPSVLGYLNYSKPYFAFGKDVFGADSTEMYTINYNNGVYQLTTCEWFYMYDRDKSLALYDYKKDSLLKKNVLNDFPDVVKGLELKVKANIQQYTSRVTKGKLTVEK